MKSDYIDALRYAVDYEMHCLGKWNIKEENNMDIPGTIRKELKRIYGKIDPLNCIEDMRMDETILGGEIRLTLRIPTSCERYAQSSPLCDAPIWKEYQDQKQVMNCRCGIDFGVGVGAQKAPEKKAEAPKKKDAIDFAKPDRILFSGPKTIVFWPDGSKTIVSLGEGQEHDEYTAFCAAIVKKMFGATHKAKKFLDKVKTVQQKKAKKIKEMGVDLDE